MAECLEDFLILLDKIWSHPRIFSIRASTFWPRHKYDYKRLEHEFKDVVKRRGLNGDEDNLFRQQNENTCRW